MAGAARWCAVSLACALSLSLALASGADAHETLRGLAAGFDPHWGMVGIGEPLVGRLLRFDALGMRFRETGIRPDPHCPVCAPDVPFPGYIDYAAFCRGG